ncbi:MAG: MutS-related protein [Bacillota bacterium]
MEAGAATRRGFMDEQSANIVGFKWVWQQLTPVTPYGRELKNQTEPYLPGEEEALRRELDTVEAAVWGWQATPASFRGILGLLAQVKDLRGSLVKAQAGGVLDTVELYEIKRFVLLVREIIVALAKSGWQYPPELQPVPLGELEKALDPSGKGERSFYIDESHSRALARIRLKRREGEKAYREERTRLYEEVKAAVGLAPNYRGELTVSKADSAALEAARRHPQVGYVRETEKHVYFQVKPTPRMMEIEGELEQIKQREYREEARVRAGLSRVVARCSGTLTENMGRIGALDLLIAKAELARRLRCTKPEVLPGNEAGPGMVLVGARHPVVEEALSKRGRSFTPVTIELDEGATVMTGPNMGGKSVTLKTIGLCTAMAQYGLMVPALRFAFKLRGFVFFSQLDEGASVGLSSFGAEVTHLNRALARRSERGLLLLDELTRGTNPSEGFAISAAVLQVLRDTGCITVFASHYDGLAQAGGAAHWQVKGLSREDIAALNQCPERGVEWLQEHMDYRLERVEEGRETPKDAIAVARALGLDHGVLELAEAILARRGGVNGGMVRGGLELGPIAGGEGERSCAAHCG